MTDKDRRDVQEKQNKTKIKKKKKKKFENYFKKWSKFWPKYLVMSVICIENIWFPRYM